MSRRGGVGRADRVRQRARRAAHRVHARGAGRQARRAADRERADRGHAGHPVRVDLSSCGRDRGPGRGPPGDDRRARAVHRGDPARRERPPGGPRGSLRGGGQVSGVGGADPRRRLSRPGGRERRLDLRESPGHPTLGGESGSLAGGPLLLATPRPRRRHRSRLGRVPRGVQRAHHLEPRVPHGARGRHGAMGAGAGVSHPRRGRAPLVDPGHHLRHHRAQERRGADRVPGVSRQAHGPAEPGVLRGDARDGHRAGASPRPRGGRALPRPRQLQARERLARAPRRGHAAGAARRAPEGLHP